MFSRQFASCGRVTGIIVIASLCGLPGCRSKQTAHDGVVVVSCDPGEAAAHAALIPGDVVLSWRQGRANGDAASPFHLALVEQELAPHGPVSLTVVRDGRRRRVAIATGRWKLTTRPRSSLAAASPDDTPPGRVIDEEAGISAEWWTTQSRSALDAHRLVDSAWFDIQTAVALARSGQQDAAATPLDAGASKIAEPRLLAAFWELAGDAMLNAGQTGIAAQAFDRTVALLEAQTPDSPALAHALLQRCRADFRACGDRASRALGIYAGIGASTIESAQAVATVGAVSFFGSDLDQAERAYSRALEITRATMPGSPTELNLLGNLGLVAMRRGDFDGARSYYEQELTGAIELGGNSIQLGHAANYLGLLAKNTGRYRDARNHYEQALSVFESLRPEGLEVAGVLTNLGNIERLLGRLSVARTHHERALERRRKIDPDGPAVASSLHNVGAVARHQGDLEAARRSLDDALVLKRSLAPGSLWVANTHHELGEISWAAGNRAAAFRHHSRALEIRRRVAPSSPDVASSLLALGYYERGRGQSEAAESLWREAIDIVGRRRPLDGADAWFRARYRGCSLNLADLLIEDGRTTEAWKILEQDRALTLRTEVVRRASAPAEVPRELWFARNRSASRLARLEDRLSRIDPVGDEVLLARIQQQIDDLRTELDRLTNDILRAAPGLDAMQTPTTLSLAELRQRLDPGTAVVAFAVGDEMTLALAMGAAVDGEIAVQPARIEIGRPELARRIDRLNAFIARGRTAPEVEPAMTEQGLRLFELLLGPVWSSVGTAERLLVIPDGPLYELAFAALVVPGDDNPRYLGHSLALFTSPSASLAVELGERPERTDVAGPTVVAFGDPLYPDAASEVRQRGLRPLPGTGFELEAVRRVFGDNAAVYRGPDATEANFRNHARPASIVHLAVHTRIDPEAPMDSAIFLSQAVGPVNRSVDGVVSAWDIVDGVGPSGEVVVLSSCSTARGQVVSGEGILGIARAFHVTGAHTVVGSLWEVPDRATARLMADFYTELARSRSTVDALHLAQRRIAADPDFRHPYNWASFQVMGDWR
ncbi:MAG: CHAT domain-containing tetratricopeptide repeat protein [Thermoanaerobaculales bacterium]|jgi:CHAT domain-containing protein/Tfp pilus assembly protein PilF|nr:CHAT domain-containing tetratricopeptide repeat protein [Thermoanaerobaculales bacterium]